MSSKNIYEYNETPTKSTGALVIDLDVKSEEPDPWVVGLVEYSIETGWDTPPKPGQVYVQEDDFLRSILKMKKSATETT